MEIFLNGKLVQVGKEFIDFEAETTAGNKIKVSQLKGRPFLLIFWDADSEAARILNEFLSSYYFQIISHFEVVSLSLDENQETWKKASIEDQITWINLNVKSEEASKVKALYNVQAIPTLFWINSEGLIFKKEEGFSKNSINEMISNKNFK